MKGKQGSYINCQATSTQRSILALFNLVLNHWLYFLVAGLFAAPGASDSESWYLPSSEIGQRSSIDDPGDSGFSDGATPPASCDDSQDSFPTSSLASTSAYLNPTASLVFNDSPVHEFHSEAAAKQASTSANSRLDSALTIRAQYYEKFTRLYLQA